MKTIKNFWHFCLFCLRVTIYPLLGVTFLALVCSCVPAGDEENVRLYIRAGDMYAQGRFPETAELLGNIQHFPPALVLRAKAEYFSDDLAKAEKTCRQAIRLRPTAFEAKLYLARILREKGETSEAERITEALLADNPQDIRVLRLASNIALERGKSGEASALLDQAAELSAESALVLLDRARLHWIAGRGTEALGDLERARAMMPRDTPLYISVAHLESLIKERM